MNDQTKAPGPSASTAAQLEAALCEIRDKRNRHQESADISAHRAHFAARAREAAGIQEWLGASAETCAETWAMAAAADPSNQDAPSRFVALLIEAGQLAIAAEWVKWQAARDFSRQRLVVAQARVWLAGGMTRQALSLLMRARKKVSDAWPVNHELSRIFAIDRRYQAAILALRPHAEGKRAAEAAQLADRLRDQWKAWTAAGERWRVAAGSLLETQDDGSALAERAGLLAFRDQDPIAAEYGMRWVLRRFPKNIRLIFVMSRLIYAAHGLKPAHWRVLHLYRLARLRLPDDARVALLFLEMFDGHPLRMFYAREAGQIAAQFESDMLVQRKLLHQEVLDGSAEFSSPELERILCSSETPIGLRATCALRAAIRSSDSPRALRQFLSDPAYKDVRQRFPSTQWIASQAKTLTNPRRCEKARVAICISGQLRSFFEVWPFIESRVVRPLGADVFIDTWRRTGNRAVVVTEVMVRDLLGLHTRSAGVSIEQFASLFPRTCQALNSKEEVTEAGLKGLNGVQLVRVEEEDLFEHAANAVRVPVNQGKMFYKIARSTDLVKQHEQASGFRYDAIMRLRPDFLIKRFDCDEMLATLENPLDILLLKRHAAGIDDQFAFGSRRAMMLYSLVWPMIELSRTLTYLPINQPHTAERLLFDHLFICGIRPTLTSNSDGAIARRLPDWKRILPAFAADAEAALAAGTDVRPIMQAVFQRAATDLGNRHPRSWMEQPAGALAQSLLRPA